MAEVKAPAIYGVLSAVSADLAKVGIGKNRQNKEQHYNFRGIDDLYNVLAPIAARHGLVILPRILNRTVTERTSRSGSALYNVVVEAEYDLVAASDGSLHTIKTFGEAMDSADKATNKAMSASYKYGLIPALCIPIVGSEDADETTPEDSKATAPEGFDDWLADMESVADEGTSALEAAWKKSQPYLRKHLTDTDPQRWVAIKAKAAKMKELAHAS